MAAVPSLRLPFGAMAPGTAGASTCVGWGRVGFKGDRESLGSVVGLWGMRESVPTVVSAAGQSIFSEEHV